METATYSLQDYKVAKQQTAGLVLAIKQYLVQHNLDGNACQALLTRLAEDRFNLAVVGQFKRGKSSLMNAVIGRDLLPTGLLPLTSVITTLCYGPRERAVLKRKGWAIEQDVAVRDLANYVTEKGNPGNSKGIIEARVELPIRLLRQGLHFSDTPGVGSAQRGNTETTYAFLPQADAVIFVTSVDAPLSEAERVFLQDIRQWVRKIFVVVNKTDLLAEQEREEVLAFIRKGIAELVESDNVRLFPLSAKLGLEAKLRRDGRLLALSGLEEFEASLALFLANEKRVTFLVSILDRAYKLLPSMEQLPSGHSAPDAKQADEADSESTVAGLARALINLQKLIQNGLPAEENPIEISPFVPAELTGDIIQEASVPANLKKQGDTASSSCPLCAAEGQALFDFFAHWQYVLCNSSQARNRFARSRGFCHVHTWQFQQVASPYGIAEGYLPLIEAVNSVLTRLKTEDENQSDGLSALLPRQERCSACQVLREAANAQAQVLLEQLATVEGSESYARSGWICLPHLRYLITKRPSPQVMDLLLQRQVQCLTDLSDDMKSFVLKREAHRRGLINNDEETSWFKAMVLTVGDRLSQYHWEE